MMKIHTLNKFGFFTVFLRIFFKIGVVKIHYRSIIWMTKIRFKLSWCLFATYNLSFTNTRSRSFQWLFNQTLFPWKLFCNKYRNFV